MNWSLTNVYLQPIAILATSELNTTTFSDAPSVGSPGSYNKRLDSSIPLPPAEIAPLNQVLRKTFSTIPFIWQSQLAEEYTDVGEALSQMTELDEGNECGIDRPVYEAACFVATGLMVNSFPVPRVFSHGPRSVVFNWSDERNNLYLTVSADKISALISSPDRIQTRLDFSAGELLNADNLLKAIRSAHLKQPVLMPANSTSDPSGFVG